MPREIILASLFLILLLVSPLYLVRAEDAAVDELVSEEEFDKLYKEEGDNASGDPAQTGYLIVHRKFDADAFAVGKNISINVRIFNVGAGAAYDVYAKDGWPLEHFDLVKGELTANFESIEAGDVQEFNFTIVPKAAGGLNGFPAVVLFRPTEKSQPVTVTSNFYNGQVPIFTPERLAKLSKTHELETGVFWTGLAASVLVPFAALVYYSTNFVYGVPSSVFKSKSS